MHASSILDLLGHQRLGEDNKVLDNPWVPPHMKAKLVPNHHSEVLSNIPRCNISSGVERRLPARWDEIHDQCIPPPENFCSRAGTLSNCLRYNIVFVVAASICLCLLLFRCSKPVTCDKSCFTMSNLTNEIRALPAIPGSWPSKGSMCQRETCHLLGFGQESAKTRGVPWWWFILLDNN